MRTAACDTKPQAEREPFLWKFGVESFVVSVEVIHEVATAYGSPISLSRCYSTTNVSSIKRLPNVADSATLQCMCHDFGIVNADRQCYLHELALAGCSVHTS